MNPPNGNASPINISCNFFGQLSVEDCERNFENTMMCEGFVFRVQLRCEERYLAALKDVHETADRNKALRRRRHGKSKECT